MQHPGWQASVCTDPLLERDPDNLVPCFEHECCRDAAVDAARHRNERLHRNPAIALTTRCAAASPSSGVVFQPKVKRTHSAASLADIPIAQHMRDLHRTAVARRACRRRQAEAIESDQQSLGIDTRDTEMAVLNQTIAISNRDRKIWKRTSEGGLESPARLRNIGDEPLPIDRSRFEGCNRTDDAGDVVRTATTPQLLSATVNHRFEIDTGAQGKDPDTVRSAQFVRGHGEEVDVEFAQGGFARHRSLDRVAVDEYTPACKTAAISATG